LDEGRHFIEEPPVFMRGRENPDPLFKQIFNYIGLEIEKAR
jgi:hypothetical protein